jgi:hypothetical protein
MPETPVSNSIYLHSKITVTLKVGAWYWLLGVLASQLNNGENDILDSMYEQIMEQTDV